MSMYNWAKMKALRFLAKSQRVLSELNLRKKSELSELQKSIYDICLNLIKQPTTDIRHSRQGYMYHIENSRFLIVIKYSTINSTITLIDNNVTSSSVFEIYMDRENIDIIADCLDREIHRRIMSRESLRSSKVKSQLQMISSYIDNYA